MTKKYMSGDVAYCCHPSVLINEELQERGWTLRDLVFRMRRYEGERDWKIELMAMEMYMCVHEPNILMSQEQADGMGLAFDVNPQLLMNLHNSWREWKLKHPSDTK